MRFFLGSHRPGWLARMGVPLFVSDRTLRRCGRLPRAVAVWGLDSGGFTELQRYGSWDFGPSPVEYVDRVRTYRDEIGQLAFAAPADWMCEPWVRLGGIVDGVRFAGTGLSVVEHQWRTVENFCELRSLAPDLPIMPVIQGWSVADYVRCVEMYACSGVDLASEARVGLGSVCRRQGTQEAAEIVAAVVEAVPGIALHAFGVKQEGLRRYGDWLASADSLAWSFSARYSPPLARCAHRRCVNCPWYALNWRARLLASLPQAGPGIQLGLFGSADPGEQDARPGTVSMGSEVSGDDGGCRLVA